MSEGELKKRILKYNEAGLYGLREYSLSAEDVFREIDEAKKDFPKKHVDMNGDYYHAHEVTAWKKKWLVGDSK